MKSLARRSRRVNSLTIRDLKAGFTPTRELAALDRAEFMPISEVVSGVLSEIKRRMILRERFEAAGIILADAAFIAYADRTGVTL